jgi:hypothetical protein
MSQRYQYRLEKRRGLKNEEKMMHSPFARFASLLSAVLMLLVTTNPAFAFPSAAAGNYYVSPSGNDSNSGSSPSAPFKTFAKAVSVLTPGSTLNVLPGTYYDRLLVKQSGAANAPITILGQGAIINGQGSTNTAVELQGSYIVLKYIEVINGGSICVNIASNSYVTVDGIRVHGCYTHGIHVYQANHTSILNSTVYWTVLQNASRNMDGGWASAIKVRESDTVLLQGNRVFNNYGEGLGTRATNITIQLNEVFDNFSANIYTNSENALIERNMVYCSGNTAFYRNGKPAGGIVMGEDYFSGWGARLRNARVINNIVTRCKNGIRYEGADPRITGAGLKFSTIAYNTLYGSVEAPLSIVYEPAQAGSVIANNIIWQANNRLVSIDSGSGLTLRNNLWKAAPPPVAQGPGDRYGAPGFVVSNPLYTATDYRLSGSSAALGGAADLNIQFDYFNKGRSVPYDIGATEGPEPWYGSVSITSNRNVVAVGRAHIGSEVMTYNGVTGGSLKAYLPMLFKNAWNSYNAAAYVQNVDSSQTANITLNYYDAQGDLICSVADRIAPLASKGYWMPAVSCLPDGWAGAMVVTSSAPIAAVARLHIGGEIMTYNGFSGGSPNAYVPMLFKNAFGGSYNAALYVQNVDPARTANITIQYYDSDGHLTCSVPERVAPLASSSYWLPDVSCLPAGWVGGAVVKSDAPVVSVGRLHIGAQIMTYSGPSEGNTGIYIPMLFKKAWGGSYNAAFYIQNVNDTRATNLTIRYYDSQGNLSCTQNDRVSPLASKGYWVPEQSCLPAGWVGGAVVTSDSSIVAVGRPHIEAQISTFPGIPAGDSRMFLPMLFKYAWGGSYNSAFYIQNTDSGNPASVTVKFYDVNGALKCTRTDSIPASATLGYWVPSVECN